jgi:apolipoprotein D and lipocalin family protein
VELARYGGTWYEIARMPLWFQRNCLRSQATYGRLETGEVSVLNECDTAVGGRESIRGRARVVDAKTNAKLEVSFFRPFWGDYWIIDLGRDYEYAVVGHPGRDYLWILSRTPQLEPATLDRVYTILREQGYDPAQFEMTPQ